MNDSMFSQIDFGELKRYLDDDDVTDISYSNNGQLHLKTLSKGIFYPNDTEVKINAYILGALEHVTCNGESVTAAEDGLQELVEVRD